MAMLALLDNAESIYGFLHSRLEGFLDRRNEQSKPLRIYLVGSTHGGTGSVLVVEIAFLLRQILSELELDAVLHAVVSTAERTDGVSTELATACGIACLREIAHFYRTDGLHPGIPGLPYDHLSTPPWNNVYLVHTWSIGSTYRLEFSRPANVRFHLYRYLHGARCGLRRGARSKL